MKEGQDHDKTGTPSTEAKASNPSAGAETAGHEKRGQAEHNDEVETENLSDDHYFSSSAEYIYRLADKTFQMEMDRYESLISSAGRLAASVSILAVALFSLTGLIYQVLYDAGFGFWLQRCCFIVGFFLVGSLACTIASHYRFKYQALASPAEFAKAVQGVSKLDDAVQAATRYAEHLEPVYASLRERNERIRRLISASIVLLGLAVCTLVAAVFLSPINPFA